MLNSCKQKNQMDIRDFQQLGKDKEGNLTTFIYTDANAHNEVVEYLVRAEHPFTFVEKHDFTGMVQRGSTPQYKGFSASTAKRDIMKSFKFYKEKLKSILHAHSSRFCLTSDLWTSRNKLESPHMGYNIANLISEELQYWGITDKIFSITLDNATNNDTTEMFLKEKLSLPLHDSAIKYKDVLNLYYSHLSQNSCCPLEKIEEHDWMLAELVRDFLKVFDDSTKFFCDLMRQKFVKYWGDIPFIFGMAIILDPRFKIEENAYKNSEIGAQTQNTRSSLSSTSFLGDQEEQNAYHMVKRRREQASSVTSGGLSEFQFYLNQPLLEIDEEGSFDLLDWWKTNQSKYPILSIMAREILSVPVSTVASKASFSVGGRAVSDKRCGLSPKTVEALVCLKDWNLVDTRRQEAKQEAELAKAFERLKLERPEWMPRSPPHDQQSNTSR
ncbi:hypothetical protein ACB092_06G006700 [Castanea dentata]